MEIRSTFALFTAVAASVVVIGAAGPRNGQERTLLSVSAETPDSSVERGDAPDADPVALAKGPATPVDDVAAPGYVLNWWSVNSGGDIAAVSTSYRMGLSVGQSVAGSATSSSYNLGVGFWYGAATSVIVECPILTTGDVNVSGSLTSADIIYLVNFVFKAGPLPLPCEASGDVNCGGSVTSSDIIYMVNHVFKGGPAPCDACSIVPGLWACP